MSDPRSVLDLLDQCLDGLGVNDHRRCVVKHRARLGPTAGLHGGLMIAQRQLRRRSVIATPRSPEPLATQDQVNSKATGDMPEPAARK